jgi:hypothetical protein
MEYNMFPVIIPELKKRGRPLGSKNGIHKVVVNEPKKLGMPYKFNTLDENGNTMNPRDGTLERRGKYINILTKMKKYHKLDFPSRDEYQGKSIDIVLELLEKMREHIREAKIRNGKQYQSISNYKKAESELK